MKTVFAIAFALAATPLFAADFDAGMTAYDAGDYETALAEFSSLATQGHAQAQSQLAWMYDNGRGVTQSYESAFMWILLSIENGNENGARAQDAIAGVLSASAIKRAEARAEICRNSAYADCGLSP